MALGQFVGISHFRVLDLRAVEQLGLVFVSSNGQLPSRHEMESSCISQFNRSWFALVSR